MLLFKWSLLFYCWYCSNCSTLPVYLMCRDVSFTYHTATWHEHTVIFIYLTCNAGNNLHRRWHKASSQARAEHYHSQRYLQQNAQWGYHENIPNRTCWSIGWCRNRNTGTLSACTVSTIRYEWYMVSLKYDFIVLFFRILLQSYFHIYLFIFLLALPCTYTW